MLKLKYFKSLGEWGESSPFWKDEAKFWRFVANSWEKAPGVLSWQKAFPYFWKWITIPDANLPNTIEMVSGLVSSVCLWVFKKFSLFSLQFILIYKVAWFGFFGNIHFWEVQFSNWNSQRFPSVLSLLTSQDFAQTVFSHCWVMGRASTNTWSMRSSHFKHTACIV